MNVVVICTAASAAGGALVAAAKMKDWVERRSERRDARLIAKGREDYEAQIKDSFVHEVATNHLPHVYDALKLIAEALHVHLPDPPPIKWLPYDPDKH